MNQKNKKEVTNEKTIDYMSVFSMFLITLKNSFWISKYKKFNRFVKIYKFLNETDENVNANIIRKILKRRIINDILWIYKQDVYLSCIFEFKILFILRKVHNENNHWT